MIPELFIEEWKSFAPWLGSHQVEQDLVLSRAIIEIYSDEIIQKKLAFRGGTALHKIHLSTPARYSEDLDFVQIDAEGIGSTLDLLRERLDPWLGTPRREFGEGLVRLLYRYQAEMDNRPMKVKIEINSREHFAAQKLISIPFRVNSRWVSGNVNVTSLRLDWLLGSKLRALYQRRKGRDLFDLSIALQDGNVAPGEIVDAFLEHLEAHHQRISRAELEENMKRKLEDKIFMNDVSPLLASQGAGYNLMEAYTYLSATF